MEEAEKMMNEGRRLKYELEEREKADKLKKRLAGYTNAAKAVRLRQRLQLAFETRSPKQYNQIARIWHKLDTEANLVLTMWIQGGRSLLPQEFEPLPSGDYTGAWTYAFHTHLHDNCLGRSQKDRLAKSVQIFNIVKEIGSRRVFLELRQGLLAHHISKEYLERNKMPYKMVGASRAIRQPWRFKEMEEVLKANSLLNLVKLRILRIKTLEAYKRAARVADPHIQASDSNTLTDRQYTKVLLLNLDRKARARNPASSINNEVVKALGLALLMSTSITINKLEKDLTTHDFNVLIKNIYRVHLWIPALGRSLTPIVNDLFEGRNLNYHFLFQDLTEEGCDRFGYDWQIGTPNDVPCTGHHESEDEFDLPELDMESDSEENQEATTHSGDVMDLDQYGPDAIDEAVVMDSDAEGKEERSDTEQLIWEAGRKAEREKAEKKLRKCEADDWDRDGDETDNEEDEEEDGEEEEEEDEDK
ncbi:MAG: hypothetical protein M1816_003466 [Peltula sp. TS41687]|nr:MAG: hypothetical protein M1816_003466 [Peltula sp. TS41687]